jgi:hypothetical protein
MIKQYGNTTAQVQASSAGTTLNCTTQLACSYPYTFKPGSLSKDYVNPLACTTAAGSGTTIAQSGTTLLQSGSTLSTVSQSGTTVTTLGQSGTTQTTVGQSTSTATTTTTTSKSGTTLSAGGAQPPPVGRKKRQAGMQPGKGGSSPPPVAADFNTAALFLKKYMELDEEDRFAIGHRYSKNYNLSIYITNDICQLLSLSSLSLRLFC